MPRIASGIYSLPTQYNPVVAKTTITKDWANTSLVDIATELTNSLDRSGRGAMVAPLQLPDGTAAAPALTFSGDVDTGLYRPAANSIAVSTGGVQRALLTASALNIAAALSTQGPILNGAGAAGEPAYSFADDPTAGLYRAGSGDLRIAIAGTDKVTLTATALTVAVATALPNGSSITDTPTPLVVGGTGVAFTNSWVAGVAGAPRYWKDALGLVHADGATSNPATPTTSAFTLPSGYRPARRSWFALTDEAGTITFADIATSGTVTIRSNGAGVAVHLSGIVFPTF